MGAPSEQRILEYLRSLNSPQLAGDLYIWRERANASAARIGVATDQSRMLLKLYSPETTEEALREIAGLRLGGGIRLAPTLILADEQRGLLGVPAVLLEYTSNETLEGVALDEGQLEQWLFLLIMLHHLPPKQVSNPSSMSADPLVWWQRNGAAWSVCQQHYAGPAYARMLDALTKLRVIVEVHLNAHRDLWSAIARRPCHGNPTPGHLVRSDGRLILADWGGFGLGDPAMEIARAATLAALAGELNAERYARLQSQYIEGVRDLQDETLSKRAEVFTSALPLGFAITALSLLSEQRGEERTRGIAQITRALQWVQNALGVRIGEPPDLLRPLMGDS
jgi:thiamine kinase-like enzyme